MRIMCLDIGSKRIGIALSDPLGITAQGLMTLQCTGPERDVEKIVELARENQVNEIVVGMPYNMDGSEGPQAVKVRSIKERIAEVSGIATSEWDERMSSMAAERALLEADLSRAKRRKVIDKVAAVLILQGYLDRRSRGGPTHA
ncbi:MAG: Holliday junction resolvase RuvX [Pseudomonadota bacterium]